MAAPHVARPISDTEMALRLGSDSRAEVKSAMIWSQTSACGVRPCWYSLGERLFKMSGTSPKTVTKLKYQYARMNAASPR